jgi:hypothetical protein
MRKFLTFTAFFVFQFTQGQGWIGHFNMGYASGYSLDAYQDTSSYYTVNIQPNMKYGMYLGYKVDRYFSVDVSMQYEKAPMGLATHNNGNDHHEDFSIQLLWLQVGGTSYLPAGHFEFLLGSYLGAGMYKFSELQSLSNTAPVRFAWSFRGGMGYYITKNVGLNINTDALFSTDPLKEKFATPGLSNGKTGFSYFFQFTVSGGLTIRILPSKKKSK